MSKHPSIPTTLLEGDDVFEHALGCDDCHLALLEEQAFPPGCTDPAQGYQVLLQLDLLAQEVLDHEHPSRCRACAAEIQDARAALKDLGTPHVPPTPAPVEGIGLGCVFCHDRLVEQAVYCASCLAPHHSSCFAEHGRCAVLGCEDTRFVQASTPPRRRRWGRVVVGLALASSVAALMTVNQLETRTEDSGTPPPTAESPPTPRDPTMARVGEQAILLSQLKRACALQRAYRELPPGDGPARLKMELEELRVLIDETALLQRAEREGIELDPGELRRVEKQLVLEASAYGGREGLTRALERSGADWETLESRRREQRRVELLLEAHASGGPVLHTEIEEYYRLNDEDFDHGGRTRLREIVLFPNPWDAQRLPTGVEGAVRKEFPNPWDGQRVQTGLGGAVRKEYWNPVEFARGIVAQAGTFTPKTFARAAYRYSMGTYEIQTHQTTDMAEVFTPDLAQAVAALEPGQTTGVVTCYTGTVHIVQLLERTPAVRATLAEVRDDIARLLAKRRRSASRETYLNEVRRAARIKSYATLTGR